MNPFRALSPNVLLRRRRLRVVVTVLVVAAALAAAPTASAAPMVGDGEHTTRELLPDGSRLVVAPLVAVGAPGREFSPAGCRIVYVDNPHFAASVPGAIKVNAKVQCGAPVDSLSLGVNMMNTTTGGRAAGPKNVTKDSVAYVENQNTWVMCTDARLFQYQGNAGAVSVENGRPYANLAFGNVSKPLACGYEGA